MKKKWKKTQPVPREVFQPADALLVLGVGLLIYAVAPPTVRRAIADAVTKTKRPKVDGADLSTKHPNAIDVN